MKRTGVDRRGVEPSKGRCLVSRALTWLLLAFALMGGFQTGAEASGKSPEGQELIFEDGFEDGTYFNWAGASFGSSDTTPPELTVVAPEELLLINDKNPLLRIDYFDFGAGLDLASLRVLLDGVDLLPSCAVEETFVSCLPGPLTNGNHEISASVWDTGGNRSTITAGFEYLFDTEAPVVTITTPTSGELVGAPVVAVVGTATDNDQVETVEIAGQEGTVSDDSFSSTAALTVGSSDVVVMATDRAGNIGSAQVSVTLDLTFPSLVLETPLPGASTNTPSLRFSGTAADDFGLSLVQIQGTEVAIADGRFDETVQLREGLSTVVVQATDFVGNTSELAIEVSRFTIPEVEITSPSDLSLIKASTVEVSGTVSDPASIVEVNGILASIEGESFSVASLPVVAGGNLINVVATSPEGAQASDKVTVFRDVLAPRVMIQEPRDGASVVDPVVAVSGLVNDLGIGTMGGEQATVTVNGLPAQVANRTFLVPNVPVVPGENFLAAQAVDSSGNTSSATIIVSLEQSTGSTLRKDSGDLQQGIVGSTLSEPFSVLLTDSDGIPVEGQPVVFRVRTGGGHFDGGSRRVILTSGPDGRAEVFFTLGSRAGAGSQRVEVSSVGLAPVLFLASALPGLPAAILMDSGDQQVGTAGQLLPDRFVAVVTDRGFNRLGGVPVRFQVVQGDGALSDSSAEGLQEMTLLTDSDGRATVQLRLGAEEGIANHVVEATLPSSPEVSFVTFVASSLVAGNPVNTEMSGIVLDNADQPVPGVTVTIRDSGISSQTNQDGLFRMTAVPVGTLFLDVDGSTTTRPGVWPHLEFELTTVAGRENDLGRPIYLLALDVARGIEVGETFGGRLTLPELPGFALEIAPGSVTFPGGGTSGVISATLVHGDKVPMVPNFGQQPQFVVTIQPTGAIFDPPAPLSLPNVDALAPGYVTELYSFDHDLGAFISIGPGTVSEDSLSIVSNSGVGLVKAGWHCGGDPARSGTPHDCPTCQTCDGSQCVVGCSVPLVGSATSTRSGYLDSLGAGDCNCTGNDPCRFNYRCEDGDCVSDKVSVDGIGGGSCVAALGESISFSASSNKPERVKWTASEGSPPSGMGGSFSVSFDSLGKKTIRAFCEESKSKVVSIGVDCSGITPVLEEPEVARPNSPSTFGEVTPQTRSAVSLSPCVGGGEWCFRLTRYVEEHGFGVGAPRIDISGADDGDVTAATCEALISDLTPPPPGSDQGPPRAIYWSESITTAHERFHVQDFSDRATQKIFAELKDFVSESSHCTSCEKAPPSEVFMKKAERLKRKYKKLFDRGAVEERAHEDSNPRYEALIAAIRARGQSEGWPQPCQ